MVETLTPHEVAKSLKLHPFTVTRLAREGKIPAFKVGGVWRIQKDQFEQWIQKQTKGNTDRNRRQYKMAQKVTR